MKKEKVQKETNVRNKMNSKIYPVIITFLSILAILIMFVQYNHFFIDANNASYPDLREELRITESKYLEAKELLGNILKSNPHLMGKEPIDLDNYDSILI